MPHCKLFERLFRPAFQSGYNFSLPIRLRESVNSPLIMCPKMDTAGEHCASAVQAGTLGGISSAISGATVQNKTPNLKDPQRLHLVFGGELTELDSHEFRDLNQLDLVGVYPNYEAAFQAWKAAAQRSVDNAMMRYVIVHMHKLLDPEDPTVARTKAAT